MDIVKPPRFVLGDKIRVIRHPEVTGFIAGFHGPIAPNSEQVYRIRLPRKPKSTYTIVREAQIELAETQPPNAPATDGASEILRPTPSPRAATPTEVRETDAVKPPRFAVGDKIRVALYPEMKGVVAGLCGRVGPESEQVYSVRLRRKPKSKYMNLIERQIEPQPPTIPEIAVEAGNPKPSG